MDMLQQGSLLVRDCPSSGFRTSSGLAVIRAVTGHGSGDGRYTEMERPNSIEFVFRGERLLQTQKTNFKSLPLLFPKGRPRCTLPTSTGPTAPFSSISNADTAMKKYSRGSGCTSTARSSSTSKTTSASQ
eukprot:762031-Hanusia_phi.AAC.4